MNKYLNIVILEIEMGKILDWQDKINKYYTFSSAEVTGLIFSTIIMAFIISFKDWGTEAFNARVGLFNLVNSIVIVGLTLLVHDGGIRLAGLAIGFKTEFKPWTHGIFGALFLAFVTNGNLWLAVPGGFIVHHMAGHRLGFFRYDINYFAIAMVALAGPLASIVLIIILKTLGVFVTSSLITKAIMFNALFAIASMLPIPPLDGSKIYYGSRLLYAFSLPFIVGACILLILPINALLSLTLALLLGAILWIVYYIVFEKKYW